MYIHIELAEPFFSVFCFLYPFLFPKPKKRAAAEFFVSATAPSGKLIVRSALAPNGEMRYNTEGMK